MELQAAPIKVINITIGATGSVASTVIEHNHTGVTRDWKECPACDHIHKFYSE